MKNGVGGINIDECRVALESDYQFKTTNRQSRKEGNVFDNNSCGFDSEKNDSASASQLGRFSANTILTYDETDFEEVCGGFPNTKSTGGSGKASKTNTFKNTYNGGWGHDKECSHLGGLGDNGSASRYFYCAKASKRDRDEGLDEFEESQTTDGCIRANSETAGKFGANSSLRKNTHPTVKPTSLMQYLVRLVTPKGGTILDPFMGSGSTGKAVMYENRDKQADYKFIGIELTEEYLPIATARINYAIKVEETKQSDTAEQITFDEVIE